MVNERKDIKYQIEHGYKLQTLMNKVNKETLKEQHMKQQKNKARILPFGRFKGNDDNFDFLGFTFINSKTIDEQYRALVTTSRKKLKQKKEMLKSCYKKICTRI